MLRLEDFMEIQQLHHEGWSVTEIARHLSIVHKPLRELTQATDQARHVMAEVGRESRFQTWTWLGILVLLGVFLGAFGCYYFVQSDIAQINQRLDVIQQQISARPAIGKEEYRHHRR